MKPPADFTRIVDRSRYSTATATLVASDAYWDGNNFERRGRNTPQILAAIEALLVNHSVSDWRDVEALAALGTPRARKALKAAAKSRDHKVRMAVIEYAPELVPKKELSASLIKALKGADLHSGLSQALDEVEDFHPPEIVEALFRGALHREGEVAVHFAAMLMFIHGKAKEPFDWDQRHTLNLTTTISRPDRYSISSILRLASGQPYTPTLAHNSASGLEANSGRKPNVVNLDLRGERSTRLGDLPVSLFGRVFNVFDAKFNNGFVFENSGSPYYSQFGIADRNKLGDPTRFYGPRRVEIGLTMSSGGAR